MASILTIVVRPLPRAAVLAAGRFLGGLYARFDRRHVAVAIDNLRHAFPDWDEARLQATARGVYRHFGSVILDLLWMQDRTRDEMLGIVSFAGAEHVEAALRPGKGFICATGHLGNWEAHAVGHGFAFGDRGGRGPSARQPRPRRASRAPSLVERQRGDLESAAPCPTSCASFA
jgi:lauroyl/myristoyl acyltransferase